jgi:hypothetical protein
VFRRASFPAVALLALAAVLLLWRSSQRPDQKLVAAKPPAAESPPRRVREPQPAPPSVGAPLQLNRASSGRDRPASAGSFEGRVVSSANGKGVPGAEITFEHESGAISVRTGPDGLFAFHSPKPGQYRLAAIVARDYLPFAPEWGRSPVMLTARAGERIQDIVLFLTPAIEYLGVVLDPNGKRLPGAQISLLDASQGEMALAPLPDSFVANERGEFTFRAPAWAWLEAKHPSFSPGRSRVDASVQASHRLELRLAEKDETEFEATGSVGGQVVDPQGAPVAGAAIQSRRRGPRWGSRSSATSGPDGRFEIAGLAPEGRYDLVATYPGYASARAQSVPAGTTSVTLRLAAGARLRGVVRDAQSSAPVVAFNVSILRVRGALDRDTVSSDAFMDARGQYEIAGLPPGDYAAVAAGYGYAPSREQRFSISEALDEATIDFELERGGELVGTVIDRTNGAPLPGAQVQLEGQLGADSSIPILSSAITDASGQFELRGLSAGLGSVVASADGHHSRIIAGLRFENGRRLGPLRIDLKPTAEGETPIVELEGIGATLMVRRDSLIVAGLMAGGGAAQAGLGEGDEILSVDGQPVSELGFRGAIQNIRGPEGSCVPLVVRRASDQQVSEISVCRRRIQGS